MAIKIIRKTDIVKTENIIMTIIGLPGTGKTTLGLTAKNALLLDFDRGIQRSGARGEAITVDTWQDLEDLPQEILDSCDTLVIDTVGRMLELLSLHLIKENYKLGRSTGELTIQGYGALGSAFKAWVNKIRSYKKDIVFIGHAKEDRKGDEFIVRIDTLGNTSKDEVFKVSDMMGTLDVMNDIRTLNFNPTEKSLGKNCAGFSLLTVPNINVKNNFLAEVIQQTKDHMNRLTEEQTLKINGINDYKAHLESIESVDTINSLLADKQEYPEMRALIHDRAKSLGFIADEINKCYKDQVKIQQSLIDHRNLPFLLNEASRM